MQDNNTVNKAYTTTEVAHISGFTTRQLSYWAKQGIILPSIQQAHGPGTRRLYSFDDLLQLRFIRQLMHYNWSLQKIRDAIGVLRSVMNDPNILQKATLIHGTKTILAICKTKDGERILLDILDQGGQQVMWIFLETLQEEMQQTTKVKEEVSIKIY